MLVNGPLGLRIRPKMLEIVAELNMKQRRSFNIKIPIKILHGKLLDYFQ